MRHLFVCVASAALVLSTVAGQKKYIAFGWEFQRLTPKQLLANTDTFAAFGATKGDADASTAFATDGVWLRSREPVRFLPGTADAEGWRTFSGIVIVPADVTQAVVLFDAPGKKKDAKSYELKDLRVYRLW